MRILEGRKEPKRRALLPRRRKAHLLPAFGTSVRDSATVGNFSKGGPQRQSCAETMKAGNGRSARPAEAGRVFYSE
jgi:hypothetical protein